jgi:hypothetical protein
VHSLHYKSQDSFFLLLSTSKRVSQMVMRHVIDPWTRVTSFLAAAIFSCWHMHSSGCSQHECFRRSNTNICSSLPSWRLSCTNSLSPSTWLSCISRTQQSSLLGSTQKLENQHSPSMSDVRKVLLCKLLRRGHGPGNT